ncbi:hypothetical protein [Longimicrobium sp.]|uniref:hypothetical protein n=1 Tax=Longimicrobium sp. TaxID=2029185 RepID=UPI003B3A4A02
MLEYGTADGCQRGFLIHVGESYIERVLKRLRELTVSKPDVKLHEHTMDFTWGKDDEISILNGSGLASAVHSHVGLGLEEYVARKQQFLAKVGYEKVAQKFRVKPRFPDDWLGSPEDLLVDFALGLLPHLEVETGEVIDLRFGIPAVLPEPLPKSELHLVNRTPTGRGTIRLRAQPPIQEVLLNAEVYLPHGVEVSDEHVRVRYSTAFLDMTIGLTGGRPLEWQLKLPSIRAAHRLADQQPAANLILFLHEASGQEIELQLTFETQLFRSGQMVLPGPPSGPLVEWAGRAKNAWAIARYFEIEQDVTTSAAELARYRRQLHLLASILRSAPAYFRVEFALADGELRPGIPWCVPMAATARLGQFQVQSSFLMIGDVKATGAIMSGKPGYLFQSSEVRRLQQKLFRDPEEPDLSDGDLVNLISDQHKDEMQVLRIQDLPWLRQKVRHNPAAPLPARLLPGESAPQDDLH